MLRYLFIAAILAQSAMAKKYFGYYLDDLNETANYSTIFLADTIEQALNAKGKGVPSLLNLFDSLFYWTANGAVLSVNYMSSLQIAADAAAPLLKNGTILGFNLGDELVWNGLLPSSLTSASNAVRALFPRGSAIIWYNEAWPVLSGGTDYYGNPVDFSIPPSLDWFSVDKYHTVPEDNFVNGDVRTFYNEFIFPFLNEYQQAILVPGSFGSNVNPNCDKNCYDVMCTQDAVDFAAWALADERVAGIFPWNWGGCPTCGSFQDELGTQVQPLTKAKWQSTALALNGSTAASQRVPPSPEWVGCFENIEPLQMKYLPGVSTTQACAVACFSLGFTFFFMHCSGNCQCGKPSLSQLQNKDYRGSQLPDSDCGPACPGDDTTRRVPSYCGSVHSNALYSIHGDALHVMSINFAEVGMSFPLNSSFLSVSSPLVLGGILLAALWLSIARFRAFRNRNYMRLSVRTEEHEHPNTEQAFTLMSRYQSPM